MKINTMKKLLTVLILSSTISFSAELVDAGFEEPNIGTTYQIINADTVPGWKTSASDNMMEIWHDGFNGVPAYEGVQFAEINANEQASLYQDVVTVPGSTLTWYMAHRGRDGVDVAEVSIGAPGGIMSVEATMSDGNTAWGTYSGTYIVPAGQDVTRFSFDSISQVGGVSYGNFIDDFRVTGGGVIAYPNTYTTYIDGVFSGNVITDGTPDYGQPLTIDSFTTPSNGTLSVISNGGDGSFTYTPDPGFEGTDTFTYTITDGYGGFDTETVTINVVPEVANNDVFSTDYQTAVSGNVLSNDIIAPGTTVASNTQPTNGTLTGVNLDGSFSYTPNNGFSGTDTFTYTLSNGLTATVSINVADAPIVPPTNLVAEYRMDECGFDGTAGDVIDNTINRFNGTSSGDVSISVAKQNNKICSAATFDGNGDAITVANSTELSQSGTDSITVSFWINLNNVNASDDDVVLGMIDSDGDRDKGWGFNFSDNSNTLDFFVGTRNAQYYEARNTISNTGWHHVVGVYGGQEVLIYIDNVKTIGDDASGSAWGGFITWGNIRATNGDLTIGGSPNFGNDFSGQIDEVKIFNGALTDAEITDMYTNESAGRNWNENTDARVCNTCQCIAKPGSTLVSLPADLRNMPLVDSDIASVISGDISTYSYGDAGDWQMAVKRYDIGSAPDGNNNFHYEIFTDTSGELEYGKAYWIANRTGSDINYIANLKTMDFNATVDNYPSCRSANGKCALIELEEPNGTNNHGPYIYTMTSFAVQKTIRWENVRVLITDSEGTKSYTPDQAENLGETFSATIWKYDSVSGSYTSVTPGTPGLNHLIDPCSGYAIELDKNTAGKTVQLLIPEE